jgi:1-acyl-sn-glycerol-3-phosphate acyltransferases
MKRTPLYNFGKTVVQFLVKPFIPYRVKNKERMPQTGKLIVCCNHVSNSDPLRLAFSQRRQIYYMAKAELFENKFVAAIISALGAFPVQRGKGDKAAMNRAGQLLEEGQAVGVFIEGTRSKTGELLPPKAGAVMLAYSSHAPILPCCITAEGGGVPKLFHKCTVSFGEPVWPEELGIVDGTLSEYRAASQQLMGRIAQLRERDLKAFDRPEE